MSKNRKRINKSPIVVTRETDLTGTSNSPIRANGKGGGRFDGSIFIPTTPTGGGPTPTPIPTTTTSTTDNGEITTTTTDNGEITTTTTDNGEITTTTTDNGEITTTTTDNGETTTTTTDSGETTTTTTDNGETTTTTTEDVTTTTTTIDYEVLSYLIIAQRQANGYVYTYTSRDENDEFIYSDYDVKCIEETFPTNSYGSLTIGNEFNEDGYLSIGDDELVRFLSGQISGPFNGTIRGVYRDTDLRLGNTFDKYIITIDTGEVTSIVSFDSIGSIEDCVTPTTTTTTTVLPQLNEIEGSNRFELNNSEIQTEYQNITDSAYSFQEAKNLGSTIITEVNDLITYSHNQENEWSGYLDGDVVPMGVTNNTQKVYHYDELEIGSQLYDDSHNEITGSDMLYIHSDIINSNYNEELSEVQQNGGTLSFVGYEDGIVTELFSVIIDFTGRVYPIDLTEMFYNETICFSAKNLAGDDWYFTDEEVKKAWNSETYANNATRIAISDNNEGSLSVGDTSLVKGNVNTDIDDFNDFDGDLKGVYYDIYKRFSEVAELYVITIEGGEVKGIVNFDDIDDIDYNPKGHTVSVNRIYEPNVVLSYDPDFDFNRGTDFNGELANTAQELKCAMVDLGVSSMRGPSKLQSARYHFRRDFGFHIGAEMKVDICGSWITDINGRFVYYLDKPSERINGIYTSYEEEVFIAEVNSDGILITEPIKISEEFYDGNNSFSNTDRYDTRFIEDGSDGFNVCGEYAFPKYYRFEYDTDINGEIYTWTDRGLGDNEYIYSDEDIKCLYETGSIVNNKFTPPFLCKLENTPLSVGDDELRQTTNNGADSMSWNDNLRGVYIDTDNRFGQNDISYSGVVTVRKYLIDIVQGEVISIKRLDLIEDVDVCPPTTTTTTTISGTNQFARLINWEFNNQLYVYELMGNQTVDSDFESIYCNEDVNFGDINFDGRYSTTDTNSSYPHLGDVIYENEYSQTPLNEGVWLSYPWSDIESNFELDKLAWYITDSNGILVTISEVTCPITTTTTTVYITTTTSTTDSGETTTTSTTDSGETTTTTTEDVTTTTTTEDVTTTTTTEDVTTTTTTEDVTTTTTTEDVTTTTTTEDITTTTSTTEDITTTTTTEAVTYSLKTNYTVNGFGYNYRETASPSSNIVTYDLAEGTQTGAYLYNVSYLHTGLTGYGYDMRVNGVPYVSGSGVISVNMINTPSGDVLQVNTAQQNPNDIYNFQITVIPATTTTSTTEDVTTTTTTEDITTTTSTTEDVTTTTTTEDVTTTTTTEDITTTTSTTEDVTTTTTTENITTTTTYSLPPSYQYFKSTVLPMIDDSVCDQPGYELSSPFWVDLSGYTVPNLLGKPIFRNPELTTPVMDGFYLAHKQQPINSTNMSPIRWIEVINGTVSDVGVTDCDDDTPN